MKPGQETANVTVHLARALTHRLAKDDPASPAVPEFRAVVGQIAEHAKRRASQGEPAFAPIEARARNWEDRGCPYAEANRLAADYVARLDEPTAAGEYGQRTAAEFEDALALFPTVVLLPSFEPLGMTDLLHIRATSVRILGLQEESMLADGGLCTPSEFFWHDLDHARFMVREDLAALGVDLPDAYGPPDAGGRRGTFDAATGRHRRLLHLAAAPLASLHEAHGWLMARAAQTLGILLGGIEAREPEQPLSAAAARLMLFEIGHEKAHTPVPEVLRRELSRDGHHEAKISFKLTQGFWGDGVDPTLADHLAPARDLLLRLLEKCEQEGARVLAQFADQDLFSAFSPGSAGVPPAQTGRPALPFKKAD